MYCQIDSHAEMWKQIQRDPHVWTRDVTSKASPSLFVRVQQVVSIGVIGFLFWLWFGASKDHTPRPSYPYYDTQEPVPSWSEPAPLAGNYNKKGEQR